MKRKTTPEPETERLSVELPKLVADLARLAARCYFGGDVEDWLRLAIIARVECDFDNITHDFEKLADGTQGKRGAL